MSTAQSRQEGKDRIAAIQLLRALAALSVAAGHIAFAFADHLPGGLGIGVDDGRSGQLAVMLFFIVSGFVMVIAAERQFGQPGSRSLFWRRRFIRIMPPYWIASILLAVTYIGLYGTPLNPEKFAMSLALIPYPQDSGHLRSMPFLWVGWTLFYEMVFYFIFGLFLSWSRGRAIAGVSAVLAVLVTAGFWIGPDNAPLYTLTRPVSVMFAAGMYLAMWRATGGEAPVWMRWLAFGGAALAMWLVPGPGLVESTAMGWDYLAWCGLPALGIAFAALGGPLRLPAAAAVNRAGDSSYAIYLFHVPLAWLWLRLWGLLPFFDAGPWDYFVSALVASIIFGWLFYVWIEQPMMLALNRRLGSPHGHERSA